jgi:hypothetical protein
VAVVVLLIGMDVVISLPIMGATYRPFSWMSIAPADAATLYPVIQNLSITDGKSMLSVEVAEGANVTLQRSTNLLDDAGWTDVGSTTASERVILLIDTNPASRAVFYRVKQMLGGTP